MPQFHKRTTDRPYVKSGHHTLKRAVRDLGSRAIDMRTSIGRALMQWRAAIVDDLGGPESITTVQHALLDMAVKSKLIMDSIDAWLLTQETLIDEDKKSVYHCVLQRMQLADSLARMLDKIGCQRRVKQLSLEGYLTAAVAVGTTDAVDTNDAVGTTDSESTNE